MAVSKAIGYTPKISLASNSSPAKRVTKMPPTSQVPLPVPAMPIPLSHGFKMKIHKAIIIYTYPLQDLKIHKENHGKPLKTS